MDSGYFGDNLHMFTGRAFSPRGQSQRKWVCGESEFTHKAEFPDSEYSWTPE